MPVLVTADNMPTGNTLSYTFVAVPKTDADAIAIAALYTLGLYSIRVEISKIGITSTAVVSYNPDKNHVAHPAGKNKFLFVMDTSDGAFTTATEISILLYIRK